jgi:hypothetical protein
MEKDGSRQFPILARPSGLIDPTLQSTHLPHAFRRFYRKTNGEPTHDSGLDQSMKAPGYRGWDEKQQIRVE